MKTKIAQISIKMGVESTLDDMGGHGGPPPGGGMGQRAGRGPRHDKKIEPLNVWLKVKLAGEAAK